MPILATNLGRKTRLLMPNRSASCLPFLATHITNENRPSATIRFAIRIGNSALEWLEIPHHTLCLVCEALCLVLALSTLWYSAGHNATETYLEIIMLSHKCPSALCWSQYSSIKVRPRRVHWLLGLVGVEFRPDHLQVICSPPVCTAVAISISG